MLHLRLPRRLLSTSLKVPPLLRKLRPLFTNSWAPHNKQISLLFAMGVWCIKLRVWCVLPGDHGVTSGGRDGWTLLQLSHKRCLRTRLASNTAFTAQEAPSMCNATGSHTMVSQPLLVRETTTEEPGTGSHHPSIACSGVVSLSTAPLPEAATDRSFRRDPDVAILRWPEGGVDGSQWNSPVLEDPW